MPFVERDGCRIHYELHGDGEPVVLLHGFTSSFRRNWVSTGWVRELVARGRRVVGVDLRGHGESSKPHSPERYETGELARDVAAVMDASGVAAADLVAFSMGAGVALRLALDVPGRVRRLALGGIGDAAIRGLHDPALVRALVDALRAPDVSLVPEGPAREVRVFAEGAPNDLEALAALPARGGWPGDLERPGPVEASALVVVAAEDQFMRGHARLLELLPNAEVLELPALTHGAIVRDTAARERVLAFLDGVERAPGGLVWRAVADGEAAGTLRARIRPDGRCFLSFGASRSETFGSLVAAAAAELRRDLHVSVDEREAEALARYEQIGFRVLRRESAYVVPTDPAATGLAGVAPPSGFVLVTADRVDEGRLRRLDDALRQDVPGTDGWRWDEEGFREETHQPAFEAATYLVAVEAASGEHVGIARVWNDPSRPRLGLVGVLAPYRRRGLARALLAQAFAVLHERGREEVAAEVDETNLASRRLVESLGARRVGGHVELVRRAEPRPLP